VCWKRGRSVACDPDATGVDVISIAIYTFEIPIWHSPKDLDLGIGKKIRLMAQMTGQHGLSDKRHIIPSPKPHDAHSRYLHTDTQARRPIKVCQGPVQLPCDGVAAALCR
jgi:hypothetical protein